MERGVPRSLALKTNVAYFWEKQRDREIETPLLKGVLNLTPSGTQGKSKNLSGVWVITPADFSESPGKWPQDWKKSMFIPIPKKGNAKECSNYCTIALFSHTSKIMLKILQARLQQYMNHELPDVQVGFRKGRGTRD